MISVVIPTITGRENWVEGCVKAYQYHSPNDTQIIVVKDEPSCGHAWVKGNKEAKGDYVHFTADDLEPTQNWYQEAIHYLDQGIIPAAMVVNSKWMPAICDSPLGDWGHQPNVLVPMLTKEMLEDPEWLLPIHYGSDDWVSYYAIYCGKRVVRAHNYVLIHHVAGEGRNYMRRHGDVKKLVRAMEFKGYVPPVYAQLEINLRTSPTGLDNVRINQLELSVREQLRAQRGQSEVA